MKCFFTFIFVFTLQYCSSQDSIKTNHPYPKTAAIFSAVLPGSGQVYNHIYNQHKNFNVYWKVPLIYISLYYSTQSLFNKINLEKEIRKEYYNRINSGIISDKWSSYDNYNLVLLEKSAAKSRNTLYFLTGGIYLLQILEASIDAHFSHFDVSPDLSLNISPYYSNFNQTGITFTFNVK